MLIFINKCIKYYNTIKYLRLIQIIGQLKRFFNVSINTQIDNSKNYQLRSASSKFLKPARRNKKMLVYIVWVSFEDMVTEKTLKEEINYKKSIITIITTSIVVVSKTLRSQL